MTGFSNLPIHAVGFTGVAIAALGLLFGLLLFIRRLFIGPEVGGVFTLFAILFVFVGLNTLGLALIGEYVGRIYREVRGRPRYVIRRPWGQKINRKMSNLTEFRNFSEYIVFYDPFLTITDRIRC